MSKQVACLSKSIECLGTMDRPSEVPKPFGDALEALGSHRYGFLNSRRVRIHLPSARVLSDLRLPTPGASKNSSTY